jgi:hypothetical protein
VVHETLEIVDFLLQITDMVRLLLDVLVGFKQGTVEAGLGLGQFSLLLSFQLGNF